MARSARVGGVSPPTNKKIEVNNFFVIKATNTDNKSNKEISKNQTTQKNGSLLDD